MRTASVRVRGQVRSGRVTTGACESSSRPQRRRYPIAKPRIGAPRLVSSARRAVLDVFCDRNLRLLALVTGSSMTAEGSYLVVLSVFAYESGGALAVGLVALVRTIPAAAAAALGSTVVDRFAREQVPRAAEALRTALLAGCGIAALGGLPAAVVFALAAVHAVASGALRPSLKAIPPSIARTPGQLVAANAASSTMESLGMLLGSALGAIAVAAANAGVGLAVACAFCLLA